MPIAGGGLDDAELAVLWNKPKGYYAATVATAVTAATAATAAKHLRRRRRTPAPVSFRNRCGHRRRT